MGEIVTASGTAVQVVKAVAPPVPVTVNVYVLAEVINGVGYELPLTADPVMSELATPVEPMTPVPPEKLGMRLMEEL